MGYAIVSATTNDFVFDPATHQPYSFVDERAAWKVVEDYEWFGTDMIVVRRSEWDRLYPAA